MSLEDKQIQKILAEVRPLFFYKDIQDAKNGNYKELVVRLRKRARFLLMATIPIIVFFFISSVHAYTMYLNTSKTSSLVNAILWIVIIIGQTLLTLNYTSKLRRIATWFSSRVVTKS